MLTSKQQEGARALWKRTGESYPGHLALPWEQREAICRTLRETAMPQTQGQLFVWKFDATHPNYHGIAAACALGVLAYERHGCSVEAIEACGEDYGTMEAVADLGLPTRLGIFLYSLNDGLLETVRAEDGQWQVVSTIFTFAEIAAAIELCVPVLPPVGTGGPEERVIEERVIEEEYEARMEAPLGVGAAETAACAEAKAA
jgi:hypothetical protein